MRRETRGWRPLAARVVALTWLSIGAWGQDATLPTPAQVESRLQALAADPSEEAKALSDSYRSALAAWQAAAEARKRAEQSRTETAQVPALVATLEQELALPAPAPDLRADPESSLRDLERQLQQAQAELAAGRARLDALDLLDETRVARAAELPEVIATARQRVDAQAEAFEATPEASPEAASDGPAIDARRALLAAQLEESRATLSALEAERANLEATREIHPLRRDRARRGVAAAQESVAFWSAQLDTRRSEEGEAAAVDAALRVEEIARRFPVLRGLAATYGELAALRSGPNGLPQRLSAAQSELQATRLLLEETQRRFRTARRRVSAGGLTEGMGLILRRDHEWLPAEGVLAKASRERDEELSRAQVELIIIEEDRPRIANSSSELKPVLAELGIQETSGPVVDTVRELLVAQRDASDAVLRDLESLTSVSYQHKHVSSQLLTSAGEYRAFIEENILWVRNAPSNPLESLLVLPRSFRELGRAVWTSLEFGSVRRAFVERTTFCTLALLLWLALTVARRSLKRNRATIGADVRSYRTDRYGYTFIALLQTVLLALPQPFLAWACGRLISSSSHEILHAAGLSLREMAFVWFVLRLLRGALVDKGLGLAHFRWPASSVKAVRRELAWFEPSVVVLGFVILALERQGNSAWSQSIGRVCFVTGMLLLSAFFRRLLRAGSDLWSKLPKSGKALLEKTHGIWSVAATGLPIGLAIVALLGYYYTALQFELRLRYTIGLALSLVFVNAMLLRWLFMARRKLAVKQALESRSRREGEARDPANESGSLAIDADAIDIPAVDAQTRQLFRSSVTLAAVVGLYLIWSSVLPALQGFDRVQLYPQLAIVPAESEPLSEEPVVAVETPAPAATSTGTGTGTSTATPALRAPSIPGSAAPTKPAPTSAGLPTILTLADVVLAFVFLLLTSIAAKNLPALLELSLLQRMPLDSGSRYAISSIVRYVILLLGMSVISGALGIGWKEIQWLAAALTFGLAFGLQEIFANFVSGLIILIERPIRVGDIVTVGGTEGKVTQLRMRATIVQDWDRRELVIPNKEFITGSVINWTLTDPVTRIVIPVGIAYGSDTAKARDLLLDAARRNPLVMKDPPPRVIFRRFGESSLDFELRVFIESRDFWPDVVDRLHTQIDESFRGARIEIAFPQRDVHIRTAAGGDDPGGAGATGRPSN